MLRTFGTSIFLAVLIIAGVGILYFYAVRNTAEQQIAQLEAQNQEKQEIIQRFKTERRVARIVVTDQKTVAGKLQTTLLFVEYRRDGSELPAKQFIIDGDEAHFDAEIIKFKDQFVEANDPLRGQSIILFTRVYGFDQAPMNGFPIDEPDHIPAIYRGQDPTREAFEKPLWQNFWSLYNDQSKREAQGIRGLHGEGLWGKFEPDHIYTITVGVDGGTLEEAPIDPLYQSYEKSVKESVGALGK
jgi:hypothetical protein